MDEDEEDGDAMAISAPEPQGEEAPTERLWVGSIPANLVGGDQALSSVLNINANRNITSLFSQFGKVKHSTVRVKGGENKSWALITFEDIASAKACYAEGISVLDAKYEEIKLRVSYGAMELACRRPARCLPRLRGSLL
jgi:RNA recognition motif-containing protein